MWVVLLDGCVTVPTKPGDPIPYRPVYDDHPQCIVLGRYTGSDDPIVSALGDLRTIRSGGTLLGPDDTCALLEGAGLVDVLEIERTWPAPVGLTTARRP